MIPSVLVVAGLDPSGGAGLMADSEAILSAGTRPLLCASALTVQTTKAVRSVHPIPVEVVEAQIRALVEEEGPIGAVKLGMLGTGEVARMLGGLASSGPLSSVPWVVDPVLRSTSGADLVDRGASSYEPFLRDNVVLTPNLSETGVLLGREEPRSEEEMRECAEELLRRGVGAALVKGGHLEGAASDVLARRGGEGLRFFGERLEVDRRGTGCRLASFLAAGLAWGAPLERAVSAAKEAVAAYLLEGKLPSTPTWP